ncbi:MAG: bacteriorhodopsin [Halanaeroarchaeum sp.]
MAYAPQAEGLWLWLGTAAMVLGMVYFIARVRGIADARRQQFHVLAIFVAAIAAVSYLAMALGFGGIVVTLNGQPHPIFWARYVDWLATTPLLLVALGLLAGARRYVIATLVGLDALMLATAGIATVTTGSGVLAARTERIVWWAVAAGFLVALLYVLFATLTARARSLPTPTRRTFQFLRNLLVVSWLVYPAVWLVGPTGLAVLGLSIQTAAFLVLDLVAKFGFGYVLLRDPAALDAGAGDGTGQPSAGQSPAGQTIEQ